jgi:hypothetical protein
MPYTYLPDRWTDTSSIASREIVGRSTLSRLAVPWGFA